jgi:chemotaxis protein CheD
MNIVTKGKIEYITIHPGEYYVSDKDVVISTLLGSCIAACLYDPINRISGMNHFLLSNKRYARNMPVCITEAGRYGIHAMEMLINGMLKLGAKRENLRAKAFGGGSLLPSTNRTDNFLCVGEVNCRFIVEFLKNDGIPLIASDLGGDRGRVIRFSSDDYSVRRRKIAKSKIPDIQQNEKQFWIKSIKAEEKIPEPDIWL